MKRRIVGVTAAIALAAAGTLVLVAYVGAAEDRALAGEKTVDVFVAAKAIEPGTPAGELGDFVSEERVPAKVRADDAVTDLADLGDRVASSPISPGEQITAARFVDTSDLDQLGQATVPDGMLQLTLSLAPERAVGGLIQPGADVAIVASFDDGGETSGEEGAAPSESASSIIAHKALVTTVQHSTGAATADAEEDQAPGGNVFVTLALTGPQVEQVVHTAEFGSVWLAFQPDDAPEDSQIVTRANVFQ